MPLLPNTDYLSLSRANPEPVLDPHYCQAHLPPLTKAEKRPYARDANRINCLLRRIKKSPRNVSLYNKLHAALAAAPDNTDFECFLHACDCDKSSILADFSALQQAATLYLAHRTIPKRTAPHQSQALTDRIASVSRQRSALTKNKLQALISAAPSLGLHLHDNGTNLTLTNSKSETCLIELLHLRNSGGAQTDKINGRTGFLNAPPASANLSAVFADGVHANAVINDSQIDAALRANSHSFWLNTAGFRDFIRDFA